MITLPLFLCLIVMAGVPEDSSYSGLIWIHADQCPACKKMEPLIDKLISEGEPIIVKKIPFTKEAFDSEGITKVPALKTYKNGKWKYLDYGNLSEEKVRSILNLVKGNDP